MEIPIDIVVKCPYCETVQRVMTHMIEACQTVGAGLSVYCNGDGPIKCGKYFIVTAHIKIHHKTITMTGEKHEGDWNYWPGKYVTS